MAKYLIEIETEDTVKVNKEFNTIELFNKSGGSIALLKTKEDFVGMPKYTARVVDGATKKQTSQNSAISEDFVLKVIETTIKAGK